jgi:hypothetical protein
MKGMLKGLLYASVESKRMSLDEVGSLNCQAFVSPSPLFLYDASPAVRERLEAKIPTGIRPGAAGQHEVTNGLLFKKPASATRFPYEPSARSELNGGCEAHIAKYWLLWRILVILSNITKNIFQGPWYLVVGV